MTETHTSDAAIKKAITILGAGWTVNEVRIHAEKGDSYARAVMALAGFVEQVSSAAAYGETLLKQAGNGVAVNEYQRAFAPLTVTAPVGLPPVGRTLGYGSITTSGVHLDVEELVRRLGSVEDTLGDIAPVAQPVDELDPIGQIKFALEYADAHICRHEATKRGGAIWTICEDCGQKWADDEGGFKPSRWPDIVDKALDAIRKVTLRMVPA